MVGFCSKVPSRKVAEKLGAKGCGEYIKHCVNKDMLYLVYEFDRER